MRKLLVVVLVVPAGLLCLGLVAVSWFVLSLFPPHVTVVAVLLAVVVVVWFLLGRRGSSTPVVGSESRFLAQSSKEGLL